MSHLGLLLALMALLCAPAAHAKSSHLDISRAPMTRLVPLRDDADNATTASLPATPSPPLTSLPSSEYSPYIKPSTSSDPPSRQNPDAAYLQSTYDAALKAFRSLTSTNGHPPSRVYEQPKSSSSSPPSRASRPASSKLSGDAAHTHDFHPMQRLPPYLGSDWTMELMCGSAPWSPRIQPSLLYMNKETRYRQWQTNITVSQGAPWMLFFEGSLTYTVPNSTRGVNENDVWASGDYGQTWDLMAGISRFGTSGTVVSRYPRTFDARGGANNCEDPASDYIFSLAGYLNDEGGRNQGTNQVWYSSDGLYWRQQDPLATFSPSRFFSSCDVDESGHIFSMGGFALDGNVPQGLLLNDIWQSSIVSGLRAWRRLTTAAPWAARFEHLVLVGNSPRLQKELIYVIGGVISGDNQPLFNGFITSNDVWVSSDSGFTWVNLIANEAEDSMWKRWGHSGVITSGGVLIVFGGSNTDTGREPDMYSYRDLWASFDGGISWNQCTGDGSTGLYDYFRTEQGVTLTNDEELVLLSGYSFCPEGRCPQLRYDYRDVWKTPFSLGDTKLLAQICNNVEVPAGGAGLAAWPRPNPVANAFAMTVQTRRAPWSARIQPAVLRMSTPITYEQAGTRLKISTPPNWLLLYEGSLTFGASQFQTNENDVFASADDGATWDLISGISRNGTAGIVYSASPFTSFRDRGASSNCEDPTNDDVYSLGGREYVDGEVTNSNQVWYSSDSVKWDWRAGGINDTTGFPNPGFTPRFFAQCVVTPQSQIIVAGGEREEAFRTVLYNDVWIGRNGGRTWTAVTTTRAPAPWAPRSEHAMLLYTSPALAKTVLWIMGGFLRVEDGAILTSNDVWISSDIGVTWARLTDRAPWQRRWGHAASITRDGTMVVFGGSDTFTGYGEGMQTFRDGWFSLDGGYQWWQLTTSGDTSFIRGEQGIAFTGEERLILVSGYSYNVGQPRTDFADLWISTISFSNKNDLLRVSQGGAFVPAAGVGLRSWPGVSSGDSLLGALAIAGIVVAVVLVVALLGFCYYKRGSGSISMPSVSMPTFLSSPRSRRSVAPTGNGDYFTASSTSSDSSRFSYSDSMSEQYQPPSAGGYNPPHSGGYMNGDSNGLLS